MSSLAGKIFIVTGASQGMGRSIAIEAARKGATWVTLADVKDGEEVAHEVRAQGAAALFIHTDLRRSDDIRAMVDETARRGGGIDVLVDNTAVTETTLTGGPQTIESLSEETWDVLMDINLKAAWLAIPVDGGTLAWRGLRQ